MDFNQAAYKESLSKILDMAKDGHLLILNGTARTIEVAKTYLWTASVIVAIAMFLIKDVGVSPLAGYVLTASLGLDATGFLLALFVIWGKGEQQTSYLYRPHDLAEFAYETCTTSEFADTEVYVKIVNGLNDDNIINQARKMKLVRMLRIAAPCLFFSFILLIVAILLRLWHV